MVEERGFGGLTSALTQERESNVKHVPRWKGRSNKKPPETDTKRKLVDRQPEEKEEEDSHLWNCHFRSNKHHTQAISG